MLKLKLELKMSGLNFKYYLDNDAFFVEKRNPMIDIRDRERQRIITRSYRDNLIQFGYEPIASMLLPYQEVINDLTYGNGNCCETRKVQPKRNIDKFKLNSLYKLKKYDESIEMNEQVYQLVGLLYESEYITSDTIIMKLVDGPNNGIYSLTKYDCKMLGIEYSEGLQLFSPELQWIEIQEEKQEEKMKAEQQPQKQLVFVDNNRNVHACILMIDYFVLPNKKEFYSPIMHGSRVFSMESINQRFKILANGKEVKRKELILNNIGNERCEIIFQIKFEMNEDILNNNFEVFFSSI